MNRPLKWLLAIMGVFLSVLSLFTIYISGKPVFDSYNIVGWVGFTLGFLILMAFLYYLNFKVGATYTIILLLLLFAMIAWNKLKTSHNKENSINSGTEVQLDENGNIIMTHPYDYYISLQWGTLNKVDMDLMLFDQKNNILINFNNTQYTIDDSNSIWLDYDYQMQPDTAMHEIISILGMKDNTFSILAKNYNGEPLEQDVVLSIISSDENIQTYTLPAERFNDNTNGVYVCDFVVQTGDVIEVMQDFNNK